VAPFPQPALARTLLDHTLLGHGKVWIGGGSSRHMVAIAPGDLVRLTQATTADLVTPR
jgi:prolyl-tRNA editing enzyme YbaK/EbsC (Cys-tRNA(Pro) deacylase)